MNNKDILYSKDDLSCLPLKAATARKNKKAFVRALSLIGSVVSVIVLIGSIIWCFHICPHLIESDEFFKRHAEEIAPATMTGLFILFWVNGVIFEKTREVWLE